MYNIEDLANNPNKLSAHYTRFNVSGRILLTGHSHQAWPDKAYGAMKEAWEDAAQFVDDKWEKAFQKAAKVQSQFAELMDDEAGEICLSANTHDIIVKFLSALDFKSRRKIITSDSEFHSIRRQLDRLAEEGIEIVKVVVNPIDTFVERVIKETDGKTACVMLSKVFFNTGRIAPDYSAVQEKCDKSGAYFLVDVYHVLNVVPFSVKKEKLNNAFIVGGGYKYCQFGEGNCFLRIPAGCDLRPVVTGWFAEFGTIAKKKIPGEVLYSDGAIRFAGATYDPVSHYRASAVIDFFKEQNLNIKLLREVSQHQINLLTDMFDSFNLDKKIITRDKTIKDTEIAGFLTLITSFAGEIYQKLKEKGILTDYRGNVLRLGPAPYLSDSQLTEAAEILKAITEKL